jgi:hypothetical protein
MRALWGVYPICRSKPLRGECLFGPVPGRVDEHQRKFEQWRHRPKARLVRIIITGAELTTVAASRLATVARHRLRFNRVGHGRAILHRLVNEAFDRLHFIVMEYMGDW